jgi:hypothetical protein
MKPLLVALCALTAGCAPAVPEPRDVAPAKPKRLFNHSAEAGLGIYQGTPSLQRPSRVLDLRAWLDAEGKLNGELMGLASKRYFGPPQHLTSTCTRPRMTCGFSFSVDAGRAVALTMHQRGREISGPRTQ